MALRHGTLTLLPSLDGLANLVCQKFEDQSIPATFTSGFIPDVSSAKPGLHKLQLDLLNFYVILSTLQRTQQWLPGITYQPNYGRPFWALSLPTPGTTTRRYSAPWAWPRRQQSATSGAASSSRRTSAS
jgi:hypothetical protein